MCLPCALPRHSTSACLLDPSQHNTAPTHPTPLPLLPPSHPAQTNVGRQLKEMLQVPDQAKIGFMAHSDAKRDDRRAKERYTV